MRGESNAVLWEERKAGQGKKIRQYKLNMPPPGTHSAWYASLSDASRMRIGTTAGRGNSLGQRPRGLRDESRAEGCHTTGEATSLTRVSSIRSMGLARARSSKPRARTRSQPGQSTDREKMEEAVALIA